MIIRKKFRINKKNIVFLLKKINVSDINEEYINSLNKSSFLKKKITYTLESQKKYLKKINNRKNWFILGLFRGERLIGTVGCQIYKNKKINFKIYKNIISFGLIIFYKDRKKKYGQTLVSAFSKILINYFKAEKIFATIFKKNLESIKIFKRSGFTLEKKLKNGTNFYFLTRYDLLENSINNLKIKTK